MLQDNILIPKIWKQGNYYNCSILYKSDLHKSITMVINIFQPSFINFILLHLKPQIEECVVQLTTWMTANWAATKNVSLLWKKILFSYEKMSCYSFIYIVFYTIALENTKWSNIWNPPFTVLTSGVCWSWVSNLKAY